MADPTAEEYIFPLGAADEELGKAVKSALAASRHLSIEESTKLRTQIVTNYQAWLEKIMGRFGYKTKKAMFRQMLNCGIDLKVDIIVIRPSHHEKLEAWSGEGFTEADYIKIPANSSNAKIGSA